MQTLSILTVGTLAFDTVHTPTGKVDAVLGGSVNYFSIAASFFAPVEVVGIVGQDFPSSHLEWLASRKIDVSGIKVANGKTFQWVGSYGEDLSEAKTLSTALNVLEFFNPHLNTHQQNSPFVFLANVDPELQLRVLDQVHSARLVACDSMNFWITGKPEEVKRTLARVDILSINSGESFLLTGEKNLIKAAAKIRKMGPSIVIIKQGEHGAMLFTEQGTFIAPAFPVDSVVDPTGAGDSFAGAFMGYLAEAKAHRNMAKEDPKKWENLLRRAVLAGCVMASFTVEDFSFRRLARLEGHEVVARQKALMDMIRIEA